MANGLSGNKGEWSEVYTFLRLLGDGKLYAADADLNKNDNIFYDILKIIRNEEIGVLHFVVDGINKKIDIQDDNGITKAVYSSNKFADKANSLLTEIRRNKNSSFQVIETTDFLHDVFCQKIKAPSDNKSDITIKVHDCNTGYQPTLGFSIKSRLGKPSTLLNAGANTNFIFEIVGDVTDEDMSQINGMFTDKFDYSQNINPDISIALRMQYLKTNDFNLKFERMVSESFLNNLILIDSDLPLIIASLLKEYYFYGNSKISDALKNVSQQNPLNYNQSQGHNFYSYKIKKLITESALGMLPSKVWTGRADANGGYIIVREDGEVLCYHLYNRNDFEDYLLNNVRFERASAKRHGFGVVEKIDDRYFIKLNLQIRFIK